MAPASSAFCRAFSSVMYSAIKSWRASVSRVRSWGKAASYAAAKSGWVLGLRWSSDSANSASVIGRPQSPFRLLGACVKRLDVALIASLIVLGLNLLLVQGDLFVLVVR